MSFGTVEPCFTEADRQQIVDEQVSESGPGWTDQYRPGSFCCHELLDRALQAGDWVEQRVLTHPACAINAEWFALAEQAVSALRELYQRIGAEHLDQSESGE